MKVLELEIWNVRGVRHLLLKPDECNFAIYGPNGSGKSAVVDAIDFLLTGRVSRLVGKGTAGITLSKHGPHIKHSPEEAIVRAVVRIGGCPEPVHLRRCMATPNMLECEPVHRARLEQVTSVAKRGQHVLTRREILRFITSEASTRAQDIQELLNLSQIDEIRRSFVAARTQCTRELAAAEKNVISCKRTIAQTVGAPHFDEKAVLELVNLKRVLLGASPLAGLIFSSLKSGIMPSAAITQQRDIDVEFLERQLRILTEGISGTSRKSATDADNELRSLIQRLRDNPHMLCFLAHVPLINLGMQLIDETGKCPLCGTQWNPGELREYLEDRLVMGEKAITLRKDITEAATAVTKSVRLLASSSAPVMEAATKLGLMKVMPVLGLWCKNLDCIELSLANPIDQYATAIPTPEHFEALLFPSDIPAVLNDVALALKERYPATTPEQSAWDMLTRLEENGRSLKDAIEGEGKASLSKQRASILCSGFEKARDDVLNSLYATIRNRFVALYKQLHENDEGTFGAEIQPDGAGVKIEVDFFGYGMHPPHALHSEGHQDSMGICLYLALAEHLTENVIDLLILDDVVMSVDADHRRRLARLFVTSFPRRQFFITTHDRTWAHQLMIEGVIKADQLVEFYNWNVATGPQVNERTEMWSTIEEDLRRNDVHSAAQHLRRGLEEFFAHVCDGLQAPVRYNLRQSWELGDLLPGALAQYSRKLREAKKAAQSWANRDVFNRLVEVESQARSVFQRSGVEQWAINPNVHYNSWADFVESDFRPIVEAFVDLCALFSCTTCRGVIYVVTHGPSEEEVRCACRTFTWNLTSKSKQA